MNKVLAGIATLVGTVIGAGILAIPYVVAKTGLLIGLIHLVGLGLVMLLIHLLLGEVTLAVSGKHQLPGYAGKLLGTPGRILMSLALAGGIYGALVAYVLGISASLNALGIPHSIWMLLLFLALAGLLNLRFFEAAELGLSIGKVAFALLIIILAFSSGNFSVPKSQASWPLFFLPYGVIFFSFLGTVAIPEIREEIGKNAKFLRKAIFFGSIIPVVIYVLFTFAILGLGNVSEVATVGVGQALGLAGLRIVNAFALLALLSAFTALCFGLRKMYEYDYGFSKASSWLFVILPVGFFLLFAHSFVRALEITGALSGGLTGILVILMHQKLRKPSIYLSDFSSVLLIMLFVLGALATLVQLL